jgi:flavin-dependent dehydrogenase
MKDECERENNTCSDLGAGPVCAESLGDHNIGEGYDVTVIGASTAGTAAALQLAELGFRVLLIERATFPRFVACGEGLSQIGIEALAPLLVCGSQNGLSLDSVPFQEFYSYVIRGESTITIGGNSGTLNRGMVRGRGISRYYLDEYLCKTAKSHPLIEVVTGVRVSRITQSGSGIMVFLAGSRAPLKSRFGIIAGGKCYRFLAECGFRHTEGAKQRVGASAEFVITDSAQVDLLMSVFVKPTMEVYCTPVGVNRINLNVLTAGEGIARLGRKRGIVELFSRTLDEYGVSACQYSEILGAIPAGSRLREPCIGNLIAVGDALESLDPVGGMGMTHAIISGRLAAYSINSSFRNGSVLSRNCAQMRRKLFPLRQTTSAAALVVRTFSRLRSLEPLYRSGLLDFIENRMLERSLTWARRL